MRHAAFLRHLDVLTKANDQIDATLPNAADEPLGRLGALTYTGAVRAEVLPITTRPAVRFPTDPEGVSVATLAEPRSPGDRGARRTYAPEVTERGHRDHGSGSRRRDSDSGRGGVATVGVGHLQRGPTRAPVCDHCWPRP